MCPFAQRMANLSKLPCAIYLASFDFNDFTTNRTVFWKSEKKRHKVSRIPKVPIESLVAFNASPADNPGARLTWIRVAQSWLGTESGPATVNLSLANLLCHLTQLALFSLPLLTITKLQRFLVSKNAWLIFQNIILQMKDIYEI